MNEPVGKKFFIGVAALIAAFTAVAGLMVSLGAGEGYDAYGVDVPPFAWAIGGLSLGALITFGLWISRRSSTLDNILAVVGALPISCLLFWTIFMPGVWLLMAGYVIARALNFGKGHDISTQIS